MDTKKRSEAFRRAEANLYLSNKDPQGTPHYEMIKIKVTNGELTYDEAKEEVIRYHIEKKQKKG